MINNFIINALEWIFALSARLVDFSKDNFSGIFFGAGRDNKGTLSLLKINIIAQTRIRETSFFLERNSYNNIIYYDE